MPDWGGGGRDRGNGLGRCWDETGMTVSAGVERGLKITSEILS